MKKTTTENVKSWQKRSLGGVQSISVVVAMWNENNSLLIIEGLWTCEQARLASGLSWCLSDSASAALWLSHLSATDEFNASPSLIRLTTAVPSACAPAKRNFFQVAIYTVFQKHVTMFSMISWTRTVRLQRFLAYLLRRVWAIDRYFYFPTSLIFCS